MRITWNAARGIGDHALGESPREACGLLAGQGDLVSLALPMRNAASSPETDFALDPKEQIRALKRIDARGLEWLGVYHSHPESAPMPSQSDIAGAVDGALPHLIVSLESPRPRMKLWRIAGAEVTPFELRYADMPTSDSDSDLTRNQRIAMLAAAALSLLALLAVAYALLPSPGSA